MKSISTFTLVTSIYKAVDEEYGYPNFRVDLTMLMNQEYPTKQAFRNIVDEELNETNRQ